MLDDRIVLGHAIKTPRTEPNLTLNQVADLINSDSRTILNIENYKGNPKMEKPFLIRSLHIDLNIALLAGLGVELLGHLDGVVLVVNLDGTMVFAIRSVLLRYRVISAATC